MEENCLPQHEANERQDVWKGKELDELILQEELVQLPNDEEKQYEQTKKDGGNNNKDKEKDDDKDDDVDDGDKKPAARTTNTLAIEEKEGENDSETMKTKEKEKNNKRCDCDVCYFHNSPVEEVKIKCFVPTCANYVHVHCYRQFLKSYNLPHFCYSEDKVNGTGEEEGKKKETESFVVCQMDHYEVACNIMTFTPVVHDEYPMIRPPWNKDGPNGPTDPVCSEAILLDWLTTPGNIGRYFGDNHAPPRDTLCIEICAMITAMGCKKPRSVDAVKGKLGYVISAFKNAKHWIAESGQETLTQDGIETYNSKVCKEKQNRFANVLSSLPNDTADENQHQLLLFYYLFPPPPLLFLFVVV